MKSIILLLCTCSLFISCVDKSLVPENAESMFSVYLLNDSKLTAVDAVKKKLSDLQLATEPLFTIENLKYYRWSNHSFMIDSTAAKKIGALAKERPTVFGIPFVITVDKEKIYLGTFWFLYSSLMPPCPATDITFTPSKVQQEFTIGREYPMPNGNDKRNDERIYNALKSAGVLVD